MKRAHHLIGTLLCGIVLAQNTLAQEIEMVAPKDPIDRLSEFIRSGRHQFEPIPEDIKRDLGAWLDEKQKAVRATYSDPMLPPWQYRPDLAQASMGWRMGPGEDYIMDYIAWYQALSSDSQQSYIVQFPEPADWAGFYDMVLPKKP
jgi:hypothetical protein